MSYLVKISSLNKDHIFNVRSRSAFTHFCVAGALIPIIVIAFVASPLVFLTLFSSFGNGFIYTVLALLITGGVSTFLVVIIQRYRWRTLQKNSGIEVLSQKIPVFLRIYFLVLYVLAGYIISDLFSIPIEYVALFIGGILSSIEIFRTHHLYRRARS